MADFSETSSTVESDNSASTLINDDVQSPCVEDPLDSKVTSLGGHEVSEQTPNAEAKDQRAQRTGLASFLKSETYVKVTPIGVFEMLEEIQSWGASLPGWRTMESVKAFAEDWPFILRFFKECLTLGPRMIVVWVSFNIVMSVMPAISLYLSGQLMGVVSCVLPYVRA